MILPVHGKRQIRSDACLPKADLSAETAFPGTKYQSALNPVVLVALIVPDGFRLDGATVSIAKKSAAKPQNWNALFSFQRTLFHETEARAFLCSFVTRSGKPSEKAINPLVRVRYPRQFISRPARRTNEYDYHVSHTEHEDFITLHVFRR